MAFRPARISNRPSRRERGRTNGGASDVVLIFLFSKQKNDLKVAPRHGFPAHASTAGEEALGQPRCLGIVSDVAAGDFPVSASDLGAQTGAFCLGVHPHSRPAPPPMVHFRYLGKTQPQLSVHANVEIGVETAHLFVKVPPPEGRRLRNVVERVESNPAVKSDCLKEANSPALGVNEGRVPVDRPSLGLRSEDPADFPQRPRLPDVVGAQPAKHVPRRPPQIPE